MRFSILAAALAACVNLAGSVQAAQSFAGANLYYAAGLDATQRATLLSAMKSANMKVLRVWLDAQSTASTKGTTITSYPALEPNNVGVYDDTVLNRLDDFMVDAHSYGIKLLISIHSFNSLQAQNGEFPSYILTWNVSLMVLSDPYGKTWGTGYFYEQTPPQQAFDNRIRHVLNHVHKTLGKPWKELSQYIFAFEAQNEAMIGKGQDYINAHTAWQCDRAGTIKTTLGSNSGILVTTGGESWLDESVKDAWLNCAALDVIAVHGYGTGDYGVSQIQTYVNRVKAAGKKMLYQEWGACYWTTENNNCPKSSGSVLATATRNNNIKTWASNMGAAGVPWLYWQVIPNADPHYDYDFEVGVVNDASWTALKAAAQGASSYTAAFDFSAYLLP